MQGWIKLHRQLTEWEWYTDLKIKAVWLHLLLTANYIPGKRYCGFELECGQTVTTIPRLAAETGLTEKEVRRALDKLEQTGELGRQKTNKFTLITLEKWAFYQAEMPEEAGNRADKGQAKGTQKAGKGQAEGRQRAGVNKEYKNIKNLRILSPAETASQGREKKTYRPKNKFINYTQSKYDFDEIDRQERLLRERRNPYADEQPAGEGLG